MVLLLLAAALAGVAYFILDDRHEYARFKALTDTRDRQRRFRVWVAKACALFAGMALAGLALIGRLDSMFAFPPEFAPAAALIPAFGLETGTDGRIGMLIGAMLAGAVLGGVLAARRPKSGAKPNGPVMLGDIEPMMPRNRAEIGHGALISLNAGITEELFFRLYLPLLLVLAGLDAIAAFVVAGLVFGVIHLYQGWVGVLATTVMGAVLTAAYLASGAIWVPMLIHVAIDLNALVVRPIVTGVLRRAD